MNHWIEILNRIIIKLLFCLHKIQVRENLFLSMFSIPCWKNMIILFIKLKCNTLYEIHGRSFFKEALLDPQGASEMYPYMICVAKIMFLYFFFIIALAFFNLKIEIHILSLIWNNFFSSYSLFLVFFPLFLIYKLQIRENKIWIRYSLNVEITRD